MRISIRGLFILIIFNCNFAGAVEICGATRLTQALQYMQWHEKNTYYNQQARLIALNDSIEIQNYARALAWSSSLMFLICISLLAATVTYRVVGDKKISSFLGIIYFLFFAFVLSSSREPLNSLREDFKNEANIVEKVEPVEVTGPISLRKIIESIYRDQARVPEIFNQISRYFPASSRWWTMGWDDVGLIGFQNEAYKALIRKGNSGLQTISNIQEDLRRRCRESGLQI